MKESVENKLNNIHELEFTLFCIESLAEALHKDGASYARKRIYPSGAFVCNERMGGAAMNAHPVLLQKKYARIIAGFAEKEKYL